MGELMKFEEMKFNDKIKRAIKEMKYDTATEVQENSIPIIINGDNLICKSFTGSGKTAAFGIGISERLLSGKTNGVLIIGPTRELVVQVKEELQKINKYSGLKVQVVYGGHGIVNEIQLIRKGVDILVATPGRLLDHIRNNVIKPNYFDTIVLDEADRMLDMGFIEDLNKVMEYFKPKNTMLFSATLEQEIVKLIHKYIPNYKEVFVKTEILGTNIIEKNIEMESKDKFVYLLEIVKKAEGKRVLVFVSTKRDAENVERKLSKSGILVSSIHGDKTQRYREFSLKDFKSGKIQVLVATDVAARGLQIDNVEFVVNYDVARDKDTHKHRIGRTGRMGAKGYAVNFLTPEDSYKNARRQGKRPVRSNHSIDNKNVDVWQLANKRNNRFGNNRDHNRDFHNRDRNRDHENRDHKEFNNDKHFEKDSNENSRFDQKKFDRRNHFDKSENNRFERKHSIDNLDNSESKFENKSKSFGDKPRFGDKPKFGDRPRRSFGDKPRFGRDRPKFGDRDKPRFGDRPKFDDKPRRSFGDKPSFGRDRPRKSFGRDRENRFDDSENKFKSHDDHFVPKSFRRDKEYMNSRPEYRQFGDDKRSDKKDQDRPKDKRQNLKKGRNMKFQGRFPRKGFK